jgi:protoheme IX farnesyltransferase
MMRSAGSLPWTAARSDAAELLGLLKLRLNSLVLLAVAAAYVAAAGGADLPRLAATLLGALLAAGGASAMNQAWEADRDRLMLRTGDRPCASGRVRPEDAMAFGALCAALGAGLLLAFVGSAPAGIAALTVLLYVLVYTPLKTRTSLNTAAGAVPGALPVLLGWTAAGRPIDAVALSLAAIVFVWQFPHFLAIAALHRDDYARGGFRMLPVIDRTGLATAVHALAFSILFVPVALVPFRLGAAGPRYAAGALLLALLLALTSCVAAFRRDPAGWRALLRASLAVLPGVFLLLMVDGIPR